VCGSESRSGTFVTILTRMKRIRIGIRTHGAATLLVVFAVHSAPADIPYEAAVKGVSKRQVRGALEGVSQTIALQGRPPASEAQLRIRVERDVERMEALLRSLGYYNATVAPEIRLDDEPANVTFRVDKGRVYRIRQIGAQVSDPAAAADLAHLIAPALEVGERATTADILAEEERMLARLGAGGYPLARVEVRNVVVDHDSEEVAIAWTIDTGRKMRFGSMAIDGLQTVRESTVRKFVPWQEGEIYDRRKVETFEELLLRSGLFTIVRIKASQAEDEPDRLQKTLEITERKPRTVRLGVNYYSDEGFGATAAWQHRNLLGAAEQFEINVTRSEIELSTLARFRKPGFLRANQRLVLEARAAQEDSDAYDSQTTRGLVSIERLINPRLRISLGAGYKYDDVEQLGVSERFGLAYLPLVVDWSTVADVLNPRQGQRVILEAAPYRDTLGADLTWMRTYVEVRPYVTVWTEPEVVAAARVGMGHLAGQSRDEVPPDERFYAGGGGSIRGYGYQSVGPLAEDQTPLGGVSTMESSVELRFRFLDDWGGVLFADGGTVYENGFRDGGGPYRWGVGAGLRYFTGIGPLRVDLAFPLNRRNEVDDNLEFYVSLGQAF
jgi:translocation and assembly module TamA